jgi:DNA modification methylase
VKPYYEHAGVTIYCGDCREILPAINEFCSCITDPPYGLQFMGKQWDHGVPAMETWRLVLDALKPGAHVLAFGGTRTWHRLACAIEDAGFEIRDCLMWLYGQGFPKGKGNLKPAWEPIILARKKAPAPVLNIDACRIATSDSLGGGALNGSRARHEGWRRPWMENEAQNQAAIDRSKTSVQKAETLGRWPANLLLDEESAEMLDAQSGFSVSNPGPYYHQDYKGPSKGAEKARSTRGHADSGGASRFFYTAKADSDERGTGNNHPTVKPLDLMRWLSKLLYPPDGGALVDPFMGSGSTILGARLFYQRIVGIELEERYCEIAAKRLAQDVFEFA